MAEPLKWMSDEYDLYYEKKNGTDYWVEVNGKLSGENKLFQYSFDVYDNNPIFILYSSWGYFIMLLQDRSEQSEYPDFGYEKKFSGFWAKKSGKFSKLSKNYFHFI